MIKKKKKIGCFEIFLFAIRSSMNVEMLTENG